MKCLRPRSSSHFSRERYRSLHRNRIGRLLTGFLHSYFSRWWLSFNMVTTDSSGVEDSRSSLIDESLGQDIPCSCPACTFRSQFGMPDDCMAYSSCCCKADLEVDAEERIKASMKSPQMKSMVSKVKSRHTNLIRSYSSKQAVQNQQHKRAQTRIVNESEPEELSLQSSPRSTSGKTSLPFGLYDAQSKAKPTSSLRRLCRTLSTASVCSKQRSPSTRRLRGHSPSAAASQTQEEKADVTSFYSRTKSQDHGSFQNKRRLVFHKSSHNIVADESRNSRLDRQHWVSSSRSRSFLLRRRKSSDPVSLLDPPTPSLTEVSSGCSINV